MIKYLYDLFLTSKKNNCKDLAVDAKAMFMYDARYGERKYTDEQTDIAALHKDAAELEAQENALMAFLANHHRELAAAFKFGSRKLFDEAVAQCIIEDQKREAEKNAE